MISPTNILQRIINKGGLYSNAANLYIKNEEKADLFLVECFEQCHNRGAQELWGDLLVLDIIQYNIKRLPAFERLCKEFEIRNGHKLKYSKN